MKEGLDLRGLEVWRFVIEFVDEGEEVVEDFGLSKGVN